MDDKRSRGRPTKNKVEQIPASPKEIAKALFADNDRKVKKPKPKPN